MKFTLPLLSSLLLSCSAPTVGPPGGEPGRPHRPRVEEGSQGSVQPRAHAQAQAPEEEAPTPAPAGEARPTAPLPTPTTELPPVPFTAWTTASPLTLVGPGGSTEAVIRSLGVRVEVIQVLSGRMRVRCAGCEDPEVTGWLALDTVRAVGAHGDLDDPLSVALRHRATWAGGSGLPEGADNAGMCALIDHGSQPGLDPLRASWSHGTGQLELAWVGDAWEIASLAAPEAGSGWSCRTTRPPSP